MHIQERGNWSNALGEADEMPPHARDISRVRETLVESIRRVDRLVAALFQAGHLSDRERQRIKSQSTMFDKVDQLLDVLCKKPVDAYQCFLGALTNTKQSHLSDLLTNLGGDYTAHF